MEIERINENTVKFYLSYVDIEERGFTREEVWYNRDKSEELFWEMMDEINDETEFEIEGPLWIQVHAMNNGIEVTVTRASVNEEEDMENASGHDDPRRFMPHDHSVLGRNAAMLDETNDEPEEWTSDMFVFNDFDNIVSLAGKMPQYAVESSLYSYENNYFLHIQYDNDAMSDELKTNFCSIVLEYGTLSHMTIHRLKEYGNLIMETDAFSQINEHFNS